MAGIVAFFGVYGAHWSGLVVGSSVCGGRFLLCGGEVLLILPAFITLILSHSWKKALMCTFKIYWMRKACQKGNHPFSWFSDLQHWMKIHLRRFSKKGANMCTFKCTEGENGLFEGVYKIFILQLFALLLCPHNPLPPVVPDGIH